MTATPFHALYEARKLSSYADKADKLSAAYASSDIEIYPYQVAAAMFALRSPYLKGVVLADEGSLGKTYEALLVISQMWFEGKERILLVVPTPLLGQWIEVMDGCFTVPYVVIDSNERYAEVGGDNPFDQPAAILTTYDFAVQKNESISRIIWETAIFEEAHRLANTENKTTITLKEAVGDAYKILLTATPMQKDIMDLYGIVSFIDDSVLGGADEFYGCAAVHVGILRRVVVVNDKDGVIELANPVIIEESDETQDVMEGSIAPGAPRGNVTRPKSVTVTGLDRNGNPITIKGDDFLAATFCHEIDHLDGVMFTDKANKKEN